MGHKAGGKQITVRALIAGNLYRHVAVIDFDIAPGPSDKAAEMPAICTGNCAVDIQVLNDRGGILRGAINKPERRGIGFRRGVRKGQRMILSVKDAGEVMAAAARHAGDGDVRVQLHGLAGKVALVVVFQQVTEHAPACGGVDGVHRTRVIHGELSGVGKDRRHGDIIFRHLKRIHTRYRHNLG